MQNSKERGLQSEYFALNVVSKLPGVITARKTLSYSTEDRKGYDIIAELDDTYIVRGVKIQVKSSEMGIAKLRQQMALKHEIWTSYEIDNLFAQLQMILINGQQPEDIIRQEFTRQNMIIQEIALLKELGA